MESLVPLYASLVAALHISVHHDIGSYLLESLTLQLIEVPFYLPSGFFHIDIRELK